MDITRPPDRIRQDPSRSPGGDSRVFLNQCIGCHSGMDALAGAFAYYNYDHRDRHRWSTRPGRCRPKYSHQHRQFPVRLRHDRRQLEELLAQRPERAARLEQLAPRQRQRRQIIRPGNRELAAVRHLPGAEGVPGDVPATAQQCGRSRAGRADHLGFCGPSNYNMKTIFAETAVYCMGQ